MARIGDEAILEAFSAEQAAEALRWFGDAERALFDCVFLGGYGCQAEAKRRYDIFFGDGDSLVVREAGTATAVASLPYTEIETIEVGGPGAVTQGGGFIGGGFGVQGAAEGMAIAGVLNALSTRTKVETVINLVGREAELIFLSQERTPDELKIWLSPMTGRIKAAHRQQPTPQQMNSAGSDCESIGRSG